jgi:hypothetical protein
MSAAADDREPLAENADTPPEAASEDVLAAGLAQLIQQGRSGADWFFWIAALSLVNTAITHSGGDRHFIVGMGITQIVDILAAEIAKQEPQAQTIAVGIAVGFSVFCSAVAAVVGYLARNRWQVIFGLGMFLYLLDGLLFVLVQDWMSAGFHGFALFCMWGGFSAFKQLAAIERQLVPAEAVAT